MTEQDRVIDPVDSTETRPDTGVRRTGTGIALRAVTAETTGEDLLNAEHRALLEALLEDATAANTTRTYRSPVERFRAWCAENGYQALPAVPETVAAFLAAAEAERDGDVYRYPTSTLGMWAAAIRREHIDAGHPDPVASPLVRKALTSIAGHRTAVGQQTVKADPLLAADLKVLVESITAHAAGGDWKAQVAACRDIALIVCGFYSARRRSEISAIQFRDLKIVTDADDPDQHWIQMRIRGSKTSRTRVEYTYLPRSSDPRYCPWCTLMDWLTLLTVHDNAIDTARDRGDTPHHQLRAARQAVIKLLNQTRERDPQLHHCDRRLPFYRRATSPVWRPLTKNTHYLPTDTGRPMTDRAIPLILKKRCRQAGFDPERIAAISGHSLRAGFVTQARTDGTPVDEIMRQTGHLRSETVIHHYDRTPGYRNNAVNRIPL